jgi:hypothetical protein
MPDAANVSPWIRKEMVCAERSPEVQARRERQELSAEAEAMRAETRRGERVNHASWFSDRARSREPIR